MNINSFRWKDVSRLSRAVAAVITEEKRRWPCQLEITHFVSEPLSVVNRFSWLGIAVDPRTTRFFRRLSSQRDTRFRLFEAVVIFSTM